MDTTGEVLIGIDWGCARHYLVVRRGSQELFAGTVEHSGEGLASFTARLREWCGGDFGAVKAAIELERGAVVDHFVDLGAQVFVLPPKRSAALRDALYTSAAKDDARDARVLLYALASNPGMLRPVRTLSPAQRDLRAACVARHVLLADRNRCVLRIQDRLRGYFPEMLAACRDALDRPWFAELFRMVPTPAAAATVRPSLLAARLRRARCRADVNALLKALRAAPLRVAPGVAESAVRDVQAMLRAIKFSRDEERLVEKRTEAAMDAWRSENPALRKQRERDEEVLRSIPGIGDAVLAALIAETAELLERRDYRALRLYSGVAAVTIQSGGSRQCRMRKAAAPRLRVAVYHWARVAAIRDARSKERYAVLRAGGKTHGRALRGVGDRLLAMACAMLKSGETYRPDADDDAPETP